MEMAAGAISPDQHQGVDGVAGRLLDFRRGELDARGLRAGSDLVAERLAHVLPLAGERRKELAPVGSRPVRSLPGRTTRGRLCARPIILQRSKKLLPTAIDARWIALEAGVKVVDVLRIPAVEKRAAGKGCVGVLARHAGDPVGRQAGRSWSARGLPYTIYVASGLSQTG